MHSHVGGQSNSTNNEEKRVDSIEGEHSDRDSNAFDYSRSDEVEKR